jgi:hypothetical protein
MKLAEGVELAGSKTEELVICQTECVFSLGPKVEP